MTNEKTDWTAKKKIVYSDNGNVFCKKLTYKNTLDPNIRPTLLLGIVTKQDETFIYFKTANKEYTFNKQFVISIESTKEIYRGVQ